jgi:hypothetical protein
MRASSSSGCTTYSIRAISEFLDVTEFAPVNESEGVGEGVEMARASDPQDALRQASALGADRERWVNEFVVVAEYRDAHGWT